MKTPQKKAEELIWRYEFTNGMTDIQIKQCAFIAVDEILEQLDEIINITGSSYVYEIINFWNEVKIELIKL